MTPEKQFAGFDRKTIRAATRRRALHRVLLSVWAFFTLVLLLCVGLLAYEMARQGKDPLASVKEVNREVPGPVSPGTPAATQEVTLYFASADGRQLVAEAARIEKLESSVGNCRKALEALIHGPAGALTPILPASTKVRGMYLLEKGELVVDFSMEFESELKRVRSASVEGLALYGVVNTLTQPSLQAGGVSVNSVRFMIEGAPPREAFPSHADPSQPFFPNPEWIAGTQG